MEGDDGDVIGGEQLLDAFGGDHVVDLHGGVAEPGGGLRELHHGVAVVVGEAALRPHGGEGVDSGLVWSHGSSLADAEATGQHNARHSRQDSAREGGTDRHQEAGQVAGTEEGDEDAGEAGGGDSQGQGRQYVAAAAYDRGERPGQESQEPPEGEEEENEDEAGFEGHGDRVGREGVAVKGAEANRRLVMGERRFDTRQGGT